MNLNHDTFYVATQILGNLAFQRVSSGTDLNQINQFVDTDIQIAWQYARALVQTASQMGQNQPTRGQFRAATG